MSKTFLLVVVARVDGGPHYAYANLTEEAALERFYSRVDQDRTLYTARVVFASSDRDYQPDYKDKDRAWLETGTLTDEQLKSLYEHLPHGATSGVYYNDGMLYRGAKTSERAVVLECASRYIQGLQ